MTENNTESTKDIWQKLLDIDHRIIASIVPIIIMYIILNPFKIPFPVTQYGQDYYDFVQSIPDGSNVGFMMGDSPATRPSLQSATVLAFEILLEKDCQVVIWVDRANAPPIVEDYINIVTSKLEKEGKTVEYGVDYVWLGYIAGREAAQAAFLADIRQVTNAKDAYGTPFSELPIMENINTGEDLPYGFANCQCACTEPMYVRQWQKPYGSKIATINCAMDLTFVQPYLATGQLQAVANGLLASAEMEYLTGELGLAFGQTLSVSMAGVFFVILIILGNAFYFLGGRREEVP